MQAINVLLPNTLESSEVNISLPLGVSFYVFQAASYLIDVYRKEVAPSRNIINFGCYLTMFPQLVAGPIVRYSQIADELITRHISLDNCAYGISRFIIGLAKKILIADTLGRVADAAFTVPNGALSAEGAWIGLICYAFQIYFDFSGYSDMAIGIGRMLGFTFPENFNYPYSADSIQNFWKRWHMSLSTWFQDYLYIPLGGNRKGTLRTYLNLIVVFLLCGFWHGANWTFMAWGGYYGVFLVLERAFPSFYKRIPKLLKHIYVIVIVFGGWVLF
ncbi:Peptidoglycan O-acetyltransferase [Halodesulfovibrio sp. MK-HDV]|nr:Peptidoglycan O-acetyltransferase [Halodesulfovibrio sp. MK-HDV]